MPGLNGTNTTETEVADLRTIFQQHMEIECRVTNFSNGISTFTASQNPAVRAAIVSHVSMMVTRLAEGRNPEVIIQSPTQDALFDVHEEIETEIEVTDTGIDVIQTSSNPVVVKLLQTRAAEVSDMSERVWLRCMNGCRNKVRKPCPSSAPMANFNRRSCYRRRSVQAVPPMLPDPRCAQIDNLQRGWRQKAALNARACKSPYPSERIRGKNPETVIGVT